MKLIKLLLWLLCQTFIAMNVNAQETIITQNGDIMTVYDVEIGGTSIFYKQDASDAASLKIDKNEVLMIKYKDGNVVKMESGQQATNNGTTSASTQKKAAANEMDASTVEKNLQEIHKFNNQNVVYTPENSDKKSTNLLFTLGIKEGSVIETPEFKASVSIKRIATEYGTYSKKPKKEQIAGLDEKVSRFMDAEKFVIVVTLANKTNRMLFVDLGNSFIIRNGEPVPYYVPSATTSTTGSSSGVGVNLGSIANAAGIGGTLGTLAGGVSVGGGASKSSSTVTYAQRIVSIPPMSSKSLDPQDIGNGFGGFSGKGFDGSIFRQYAPVFVQCGIAEEKDGKYRFSGIKDLKCGEKMDIQPKEDINPLAVFITYATDESLENSRTMPINFYIRQILPYHGNFRGEVPEIDFEQCPPCFWISMGRMDYNKW